PFNGDTTVAIAIRHIQEPMPLMRDFVADIPQGVENIVIKCTQKSPDKRYQNMGEMIADLKHSLINPDAVIAQVDTEDDAGKTKVVPSVSGVQSMPLTPEPIPMPAMLDTVWGDRVPRRETYAEEEELEEIPEQVQSAKRRVNNDYRNSDYNSDYNNDNYGNSDYSTKSYNTTYYENDDYYGEVVMEQPARTNRQKTTKSTNTSGTKKTEKKSESKNKQDKGTKNKQKQSTGNKPKQTKVNNTYDYYQEDYEQEVVNRQNVRDGGYTYIDDYDYPENLGKNEYDYNPKAEGFTTVLTVIAAVVIGCILLYFAGQATGIFDQIGNLPSQSHGSSNEDAERAVMPEFEGHDVSEVKTALNAVGLGCKTTFIESAQYAKNNVISAALEDGQAVLANDKIIKNTTIVLTVSNGGEGINVPAVEGMSEAEGTAALQREGFKVVKTEEPSAEYAKGMIISQSPAGNSMAPFESEVTIVLSTGGDNVEVRMPEVLGNSREAAISTF
ncbi:MAG: PASTA domain-containing protein, partial [Lachnospiraceae bacterium]|nr:PASTA domain-containing protein [Lachnospiraceae bacterium]